MRRDYDWGNCPFRKSEFFGPRTPKSTQYGVGWHYICKKSGGRCFPSFCLGPYEDGDSKGDSDE